MKPCRPLMPRSVYSPLEQKSISPCWQFRHLPQGRRTVETTKSPGFKPVLFWPTCANDTNLHFMVLPHRFRDLAHLDAAFHMWFYGERFHQLPFYVRSCGRLSVFGIIP